MPATTWPRRADQDGVRLVINAPCDVYLAGVGEPTALLRRRRRHRAGSRRMTGLSLLLILGSYLEARHRHGARTFDAGAVAFLVVAGGSLAGRRRRPVAVLCVVFGATVGYSLLGYASGPIWLALIVAYTTVILEHRRVAAAVAAVAGFGVFSCSATLSPRAAAIAHLPCRPRVWRVERRVPPAGRMAGGTGDDGASSSGFGSQCSAHLR